MYLTQDQLEGYLGRAALAAAAPGGDEQSLDNLRIAAVIAAVESAANDRLRATWAVPLADPPAWLSLEVARIVHDELCDETAVTDQIRRRARAAWRRIDMLARGDMQLDVGDPDSDGRPNADTLSGRAVVTGSPVRHFGLGDTRGII